MKKWVFRIAGIVIVLVILALVLVFINLNSIVKKGVETVGPQLTKVEVRLGSAKLSPMNGNGELSRLFVGNPENYKSPSAIEVGNVKVAVKLSSVFKDTIEIDEVNIQEPLITFEGGLTGNNLMTILKNLESSPDDVKPTPKGKTASEGGKKFFVKDVVINGGKINVLVTGLGAKALTVPLPPIYLQNIGSETNGVTAAQLCKEILKPLIASAMKAGLEAVTGLGENVKEIGKGAAEQFNKTTSGLKGLFKKEK
ncbi:MAG: hypothetical protein ABIQ35_08800 [Verrucomicrobiota bacterium]